MRAIKFLKVDWIRCKSQLMILLLFPLLAMVLVFQDMANELFINAYVVFGALVFTSQPFNMENLSESGFINMLPGTKRDRVTGRYLFAFILVTLSVLIGLVVVSAYNIQKGASLKPVVLISCMLFGSALITCSLQYIMLYSFGKGKTNQMMVLTRLIPAFAMYFLGTYLSDWIRDGAGANLKWIMERDTELSILSVLVGLFVFFVGISISERIIKNKDYA